MKKICVICVICGFLSGCAASGSDSDLFRRSRLIANENLQLKEQLAQKEKQIEDLKGQVAALQKENAGILQEAAKTKESMTQRISGLEAANKNLSEAFERIQAEQTAVSQPVEPAEGSAQAQEKIQSLLDMLAQLNKNNQELLAENAALKDQLQKLKAGPAQ